MNNLLADVQLGPDGGFKGLGTSPLSNPNGSGITNLQSVLSTAVGVMTIVAFIWFVFNVLLGAMNLMMSAGDKQKLEMARGKILYGIIGVVVVVSAVFIVSLIGTIFGIPILNLEELFNLIT